MSPESTNERLVRVETRVEEQGKTMAVVAPLVTQYAVQQERIDGVEDDVNKGFVGVRAEIAKLEEEMRKGFAAIAEKAEGGKNARRAVYTGFALAVFGLLANIALQLAGLGGHP